MNPVFWVLVVLGGVLLWASISFIFIPLGRLVIRKIKKINKILDYDEDNDK